ncbi:MAG: RnfABCDGE type electron transport complex subunit D [Deltaproteobacteria bacterium]|nr:RnfABCDGE type electron transport complex subunit D [Deltaproteobacteria bacterium]MBW1816778.1 RnfABCDGE type electron transport complex subunit D [Deltaproteobacteria bacterium]MBW2284054.1 RnfABCDGE type electron transport complex subunit D [Deltaproteobacteria bacterium]
MKALDLTVSPGPHVHCGSKTTCMYYNIMLALLPAVVMGVVYYGFDALRVVSASIASAMLAEALMQMLLRRPIRIADGSAAVSGLVLALILPASVPLYVVVVANFAGIIIGKQLFGGLGASPLNPALVGWAIIRITKTWAGYLDFDLALVNYDTGFLLQYPLALLKGEGASALANLNCADLFLGRQAGGIGASAIVCVLAGGLFLVLRGIVRWEIPLCFILGVLGVSGIFWLGDSSTYADPLFHLLAGNVMIGAFFLSTESSSSPVNRWGMVVYGLGCGAMTVVLRAWSVYPDGVVFACLLMGLFVPLLDKLKARQIVPVPAEPPGTNETGQGGTSS